MKDDARDQRAEREQVALADALGQQPRGELERRHGHPVGRTDHPDLREGQAESLREERQQNVGDVRKPVVDHVRGAAGSEGAPGAWPGQRGLSG